MDHLNQSESGSTTEVGGGGGGGGGGTKKGGTSLAKVYSLASQAAKCKRSENDYDSPGEATAQGVLGVVRQVGDLCADLACRLVSVLREVKA